MAKALKNYTQPGTPAIATYYHHRDIKLNHFKTHKAEKSMAVVPRQMPLMQEKLGPATPPLLISSNNPIPNPDQCGLKL